MNITVFYANRRKAKSSTYNIAQLLIGKLLCGDQLFEFYLPQDMPHICTGITKWRRSMTDTGKNRGIQRDGCFQNMGNDRGILFSTLRRLELRRLRSMMVASITGRWKL